MTDFEYNPRVMAKQIEVYKELNNLIEDLKPLFDELDGECYRKPVYDKIAAVARQHKFRLVRKDRPLEFRFDKDYVKANLEEECSSVVYIPDAYLKVNIDDMDSRIDAEKVKKELDREIQRYQNKIDTLQEELDHISEIIAEYKVIKDAQYNFMRKYSAITKRLYGMDF
jgi:hypothetical protein